VGYDRSKKHASITYNFDEQTMGKSDKCGQDALIGEKRLKNLANQHDLQWRSDSRWLT